MDTSRERDDDNPRDIIEIYSIDKDKFEALCELYPQTASHLQKYCISQVEFLSQTRQKREHLHSGNWANVKYRKNEKFFEKRIKKEDDLSIKVQELNSQQLQSQIDLMIGELQDRVDGISATMHR